MDARRQRRRKSRYTLACRDRISVWRSRRHAARGKMVLLKRALIMLTVTAALSACSTKAACDPRIAVRYDGNLVRGTGTRPVDGKVFLVVGGEKRWVTSLKWMTDHGFGAGEIRTVANDELACLPEGVPFE